MRGICDRKKTVTTRKRTSVIRGWFTTKEDKRDPGMVYDELKETLHGVWGFPSVDLAIIPKSIVYYAAQAVKGGFPCTSLTEQSV
jgi:hypothetical protein